MRRAVRSQIILDALARRLYGAQHMQHSDSANLLRAAKDSTLSREAELALTRSIVAAHRDAWDACLAPIPRASRRLAVLLWATKASGVALPVLTDETVDAPQSVDLAEVHALTRRHDHELHMLRALQVIVMDDCDDAWTSPRSSATTIRRAETHRARILTTASVLGRLEDRMVRHNIGLAMSGARQRIGSGVPYDDLVQEGCLGILAAVRRFDPERGLKFCTYASWWVRHYIGRHIVDCGRTIRLPVWLTERIRKIHNAERDLFDGVEPTDVQVARHIGITVADVVIARTAERRSVSLETPLGRRADNTSTPHTIADTVPDESLPDTGDLLDGMAAAAHVNALVAALPPRDAQVVREHYNLGECVGDHGRTLAEIGQRIDLSRERVRQVRQHALAGMRPALAAYA